MMAARLRLEEFDQGAEPAPDSPDQEEARLAAFEAGYKAGWDDAVAAQSSEQARIAADIARNLQGLSFTFHEARTHVLRAFEPLLHAMVGRILPESARHALPQQITEILAPLAAEAADAPVTLLINPAARPAVEALLIQTHGLPVTIAEEPTLGEGQAWLRLGEAETRLDLDGAVAAIAAVLADFFDPTGKDRTHG